jgi:hypothetical protein
VSASEGEGYLYFKSNRPKVSVGTVEKTASGECRLLIKGDDKEVIVKL